MNHHDEIDHDEHAFWDAERDREPAAETPDYTRATRTILASVTACLAGVTDRDGIHAAITADVVKATGRTLEQIGVAVTVDDNTTATLTTPWGSPVTMPVSEAPGEIIDWHNTRTAA